MAEPVRGPASYFPKIEATYGRTVAEWKSLVRGSGIEGHKPLVDWLKAEHGMGHGHANALVAHTLAEGTERGSSDDLVDALFPAKKARWRPTYDRLAAAIAALGDDVAVLPKKTQVGFGTTRTQFVMLQPSTADRFDVTLKLPGAPTTDRLEEAGSFNTLMTHRVRLTSADDVDDELLGWIGDAYAAAGGASS